MAKLAILAVLGLVMLIILAGTARYRASAVAGDRQGMSDALKSTADNIDHVKPLLIKVFGVAVACGVAFGTVVLGILIYMGPVCRGPGF